LEATKTISDFVVSLNYEDLPAEVIKEAKLCFLDWLGVTLAGANDPEVDGLFQVIQLVGGKEQATVLGKKIKTSILNATLMNGMSSHVFDYDDTSVEFLGHASVTICPCILALSEWMGLGGKDFLTAYVAGFEAGSRVAIGASANHMLKGWHATSTIGHFSSVAASAKLLGLSADQLIYAFGITGTQAAGLKAVFGTNCKPFHPGKAGFDGLLSTILAQKGFTSIKNILEGEKCFWDVYSSGGSAKRALKNLGKKWYILDNNYKFHASCYYTHASIEAVLALKEELSNLKIDDIEKVEARVSAIALENAIIMNPKTGLEAKFSLPYTIASAILNDDTGMKAFTNEKVKNNDIANLKEKVKIIKDPKLQGFISSVSIFIDGKQYEKKRNILNLNLSYDEKKQKILEKFRDLVENFIGFDRTEEIINLIENLETLHNMAEIISFLN